MRTLDDPALRAKLISKAKEAFLLAIEVYNKPSIRYRVEGFSFFICNARARTLAVSVKKFSGTIAVISTPWNSVIFSLKLKTFKYTAKKCIKEVNNRLSRAKVQILYQGQPVTFNSDKSWVPEWE